MSEQPVTPDRLTEIQQRWDAAEARRITPAEVYDCQYRDNGHGQSEHSPHCRCPRRQLAIPERSQQHDDVGWLLAELARYQAAVQAVKDELAPIYRGFPSTHWDGCHRSHMECLVGLLEHRIAEHLGDER